MGSSSDGGRERRTRASAHLIAAMTLLYGLTSVALAQAPEDGGDGAVAASAGDETEATPTDEVTPPEDPRLAEARERFRQGVMLARAGNCEGALAELRASLALVERPNTLFNMARCYEELFRYDLAVQTYERYLSVAPPDAPDRPAVEATMRQLRNLLGTIVVRSNVPAEVWIGDRVVGEAPGEVLVPGGHHAIELRAPGYVPERREVDVAGRQQVEVEVTLHEAQVTNVTEEHTTIAVTEEGGAPPAVFYSALGATAAAALVGAGFGLRALGSRRDARALSPYDREAIEAANDDTARAALLADVFFGVAGALGVTTLVLYFLTDFDGDAEERAVNPELAVGAGGAQLTLRGRF